MLNIQTHPFILYSFHSNAHSISLGVHQDQWFIGRPDQVTGRLLIETYLSTLMRMDKDKKEFQFPNSIEILLESKSIVNSFANKGHLVICLPKASWPMSGMRPVRAVAPPTPA